ncbi:ATP-binding protein [Sporomusa sphaeroides]|uniref:Histidine kinase/HSP90-like ATPase domain-containing protein n=1 Tax=Sporomusa sphaeroides DSM 2875 TaxID=1337886 RepID=A0A1U7M9Y5_9FIRM|nr:ATP-binding protein [Sporomusa sphaeroides]OLS54359.1 hypothetical protein SPSPH_46050 [Sporomusa sphaeroides DSM 2875]CVK21655.1 hypothetical protein SSPH_04350 [Sporomusa sphaeroides DSM 2875]
MHKNINIYTIQCNGINGYLDNLPIVEQFLKVHAKEFSVAFILALHEAVSNALNYGNGGYNNAKVKVSLKRKGKKMYARIVSNNNGFDVIDQINKVNQRLVLNEWDIENIRGRGLPIMASVCSAVWFNNSGNQVLLVLNISDSNEIGCELKSTLQRNCMQ